MTEHAAHPVFATAGETIFETMSLLATRYGAINLGQGFPDHGEPRELLAAAAAAIVEGPNQYPPMRGLLELRRAAADHGRRFHGVESDPASEILVTAGATEALADAALAWFGPGDEVVLFEPLYDAYLPMLRRAGATARIVRLEPPDWRLDAAMLDAAIGPRTRAIVINNPMNPTGKLWSREELDLVATHAERADLLVVADEVYEHLVFDGAKFLSALAHPTLANRSIRVASAGKSFSLTGWKVGYVQARAKLLEPIVRCHQFTTFTVPPHLQRAVALGLAFGAPFFDELRHRMQGKRDRFAAALRTLGFDTLPTQGAYFICARFDAIRDDLSDGEFCRWITEDAKVAAIPISAFYDTRPRTDLIRFCFAKRDEILDEAIDRLRRIL